MATLSHVFCLFLGLLLQTASSLSHCGSDGEFDFVIVGGGTGGLALATRLSQRLLDDCIVVVEAGPAALDEPKINIPGLKGSTLFGPYDWNFTTIPSPHQYDRVIPQNRGKVLGGTSALNPMIWDRASKADYDAWQELGNSGWNWKSMIEYMQRAENVIDDTDIYGSEGIAPGGPIDAVINRYDPEQQTYFLPTLNNLGISENKESLNGDPLGVGYQFVNVDPAHYVRSYSANGYLPQARQNVVVMNSTRVSKIDLDQKDGLLVASGVQIEDGARIKARKEVILSAGTYQSPGLLEISGIGQKVVLDAAGVEQLLELPGVGENLQDHTRIQNVYQLRENYTSLDRFRYDVEYAAQQLELYNDGKLSRYDYAGPPISFQTWQQFLGNDSHMIALAKQAIGDSTNVVDLKKLEHLTSPEYRSTVPQMEVFLSDGNSGAKGYPSNTSDRYGKDFTTVFSGVMHPLARGSVHVNSSSISDPPVIDPHYLDNEYDTQALIYGAKYNRKVAETYPLRQAWTSEYDPGLDAMQTEEDWRLFAKNSSLTIYHPQCSCSMLPLRDGGVVDPMLKVYGTANVRIVDASIFPMIISGHPQTAVYGVAEKAADIIIDAHATGARIAR